MAVHRPKTIEEAVDTVLGRMSDADKEKLRQMRRQDLWSLHFNAGLDIRNMLGLNSDNKELLLDCAKVVHRGNPQSPCDPDEAVSAILKAAWDKLQRDKPK
jgi:hypothetical protein